MNRGALHSGPNAPFRGGRGHGIGSDGPFGTGTDQDPFDLIEVDAASRQLERMAGFRRCQGDGEVGGLQVSASRTS
jgi:hypothetical protein